MSNLGKLLPRFFQLLETVPPAQLRVKELADRLGVSTSTLGREFSRYLHRPVKEYLTGYLKDRIRLAMQNGRRSLSDTAAQLGFADDAYFHRTFKRLFGLTPAAFRAGGHGAE
ncbi:hypothetical protein SDC9_198480 [bioreactor metagenome]|uniref:HTH araC/xylS-type domain-containing protein n=1 Tax=bioreactor metagenome TaxID=1076179 RepID=A0A645IHS1_9ZZZZ